MIVYLIPNLSKEQAAATAGSAIDMLQRCGAQVVLPLGVKDLFSHPDVRYLTEDEAFSACDAVVTVGGDGTILHAARRGFAYHKPLLGVNIGRVGFLATVEAYELHKLQRLADGNYTLDQRGVLTVRMPSGCCQMALNDVVVGKMAPSQTVGIRIFCDDIPVSSFRGDGVIIATPTGSTAYSLSAGGPVLDARIAGIVVTPICAHSMRSPSMVFSAQRRLRVTLDVQEGTGASVSCDGCADEPLRSGESIEASFSPQCISLVSLSEADQFEAIDRKLKGR